MARLPLPLGPMTARGSRTTLPLDALGSVRMGSPPLIRAAAVPAYRHAVIVDVSAQQGANQVTVAARVRARLRSIAG
ncbi:hypothetical protein B1A_07132, partial [mine drainage metagenome]